MPDPVTVVGLLGVAVGAASKDVVGAVLGPSSKEVGDVLGRFTRLAVAPLRAMAWGGERIEDWLEKALEKRLQGVPSERIQEPAPEVVGPALIGLACTKTEEIRGLFANLIARSMDKDTAGMVHPSFGGVIKELTPGEAGILRILAIGPARFYHSFSDDIETIDVGSFGLTELFRSAGGDFSSSRDAIAIDNLLRLKLAAFMDENSSFSESAVLTTIPDLPGLSSAHRERLEATLKSQGRVDASIRDFGLTAFGRNFCAVCVDKPET